MNKKPISDQLGSHIRWHRKARQLSLAVVSERASSQGQVLTVDALSKIERGNRGVDLDELVMIARVLNVPPIELVFPVGYKRAYEVLPGIGAPTWAAAQWFTGEAPFPLRGPEENWVVDDGFDDWTVSATSYFRDQDRLFRAWNRARDHAATGQRAAVEATTDAAVASAALTIEYGERALHLAEDQLRQHRVAMRRAGLKPGELNDALAHIEPTTEEN